ncbi:MAG: hypothetical protein DYG88_18280 [Chloroflexi bacterium CFX4]|nr:hypothetical protein [Chloroflexi bacterium CFX4]MDL1924419.1 hypothetical protein [Chloroflexi bacterium CFX3]
MTLTDHTTKQRRQRAFARQNERLTRHLAALRARSDHLATLRLIVVLGGAALSFAALTLSGISAALLSLALSLIAFIAAVRAHSRLKGAVLRLYYWRTLREAHLARMALDWACIPPPEPHTPDPNHPFEIDLDLSGAHSLHALLDTAMTVQGSARLRDWLLNTTPDAANIAARQALVRELLPLQTFRDKLALNYRLAARGDSDRWDAARLTDWLNRHGGAGYSRELGNRLRLLVGLAALNAAAFVLANLGVIAGAVWAATQVIYLGLFFGSVRAGIFDEALALDDLLARLAAILSGLEMHRYRDGSALAALCAPFRRREPSAALRRMNTILAAASLQRNPFLWLFVNGILPWDVFWAARLAEQRAALAAHLPQWLEALFTLEASASLANHAHLNPHYTFPEIVTEGALFEGKALGHPLIADTGKVYNSFHFDQIGQIALITGSNMAGKSSFLRALGLNICLAYSGGAVEAAGLRLGLLRLYSCIRVSDSVTDGFSYFYAEVRRLRALLEALHSADPRPLFFLIDEIFRGTNNRERLIGSRAYIQALAHGRGVGAISTHDLELVHLAESVPLLANWHFREDVRDGQMIFDYQLRQGPCPTTNALRIMALAGLPVSEDIM